MFQFLFSTFPITCNEHKIRSYITSRSYKLYSNFHNYATRIREDQDRTSKTLIPSSTCDSIREFQSSEFPKLHGRQIHAFFIAKAPESRL
ncbi:hypothetical protein RIF29_22724 [Crotalaria pallida]|uniref:Uncharacterized protein n=1 Tax=Crotalaria pallida TaxID=3830 RepID=A0AAN9I885_CROPI